MVNWGRKTQFGHITLAFLYVEMVTSFTAVHDMGPFRAEVLRASPRPID